MRRLDEKQVELLEIQDYHFINNNYEHSSIFKLLKLKKDEISKKANLDFNGEVRKNILKKYYDLLHKKQRLDEFKNLDFDNELVEQIL